MSATHNHNEYPDRLLELLAAQQLGDLTHEEHEELTTIAAQHDTLPEVLAENLQGELLVMLDQNSQDQEDLPQHLAQSLKQSGRVAIAARSGRTAPIASIGPSKQSSAPRYWITGAAAAIAIGASILAITAYSSKNQAQIQHTQELAALEQRIESNNELLEASRLAAAQAQQSIQELEQQNQLQAEQVAQLESTRLDLASQLADATSSLNDARDRIAVYETPLDPAQLAENRRQLLTVPDAIQVAWQPFDLPDAPAEQQNVRGDVVWSDELQEGYIRFVGLKPNDPNVEQYQVWVIDERGLEQKVSGGVFNANADGEIIVEIVPGIDVGRVGLFAITIEDPGGTWVPDLSRRVVVAPRDG
ncbi:MAG: anti-sigma factor [Phycisphaerales bacterium]|nr:anti-sigma factor [Phycisphaerales bacterium]